MEEGVHDTLCLTHKSKRLKNRVMPSATEIPIRVCPILLDSVVTLVQFLYIHCYFVREGKLVLRV